MAQNKLIISQVMMPNQTNPSGNIYGGDIMKMMDSAAYAVTRKYARCNVHLPILVGDLVTCTAEIVFVGHSSMEVTVNVDVEDLDQEGKPQRALTAYFTMVALDRNSRPKAVPPLIIDTEEARKAFEEGRRRYEAHKEQKRQQREVEKKLSQAKKTLREPEEKK